MIRPRRAARRPPSARCGLTLVEVLIAMALLLFGLSALLGLFQFGAGLESEARSDAELAPAVESLVAEVRASAWLLDRSGAIAGIREMRALPVPGASQYRYDLEVEPSGDGEVRLARLRFYRTAPDQPVATVEFLLPRHVPLERRLQGGE